MGIFLGSTLMTAIFPQFARWQYMLLGFAGVGLGKNPNGFTADLRPASPRVKRDTPVLIGLIAVLLAIWGLRIAEVFSNGPYVALSLVAVIAAPLVAGRRRTGTTARRVDDEVAPEPSTPWSARPRGTTIPGRTACTCRRSCSG